MLCPCHEDKDRGGRWEMCDACKLAGCDEELHDCKKDRIIQPAVEDAPLASVAPPSEEAPPAPVESPGASS